MLGKHNVHTTLPALDLQRAKKFYHEKLGLVPTREDPSGIFFRAGDTEFLVFPSQGNSTGSFTQIGFDVEDIDAEVRELKSRGVHFEDYNSPALKTVNSVANVGSSKAAWFKDSEGNLLGLVQM